MLEVKLIHECFESRLMKETTHCHWLVRRESENYINL